MKTMWALSQAVVIGAMVLGVLLPPTGCGLKEYINCKALCQKKRDCVDTNYDVGSCTSTCSDNANASTDYARKVDTCKECLSPLACADYKGAACLPNCPSLP